MTHRVKRWGGAPQAARTDLLRAIPKVDRLLAAQELEPLLAAYPRREVVARLRDVLTALVPAVRAESAPGSGRTRGQPRRARVGSIAAA